MTSPVSRIYLDYNATTPIRPEAIEAVTLAMQTHGNASSVHSFGRSARKMVEEARASVAKLAGVADKQVIFTSGATESNNMILRGFHDRPSFVSSVEHPSVYVCGRENGVIPVHENGLINLDALEEALQNEEIPAVVSLMYVNNENGIIQPVKEAAAIAHKYNAIMHTDAVQAAGRIPLDFDALDVDFMSLSAHKLGGPQGVGALIMRQGLNPPKFMHGGGQERRQRAGTENVAGIAGFGVAADLALRDLEKFQALAALRQKMEAGIKAASNRVRIYGEDVSRVSNTVSCSIEGIDSAIFLMNLDLEGIAISSGAACSSGAVQPSRVLLSMGVTEDIAKTGLRISMGWGTTEPEIDRFIEVWTKLVRRLTQ
ncbi:MAG: cysteine desulfurase family protein [Pseudobdellovibrionaceae bacterium]